MSREKGSISIHTENIFPIIKKWLYSDKDIFIRELISNSCDAVNKLQRLAAIGEAKIGDDEKYKITVVFNKDKHTVKFCDNGLGMTAEEVKKYINQVAFSGAEDFISKYKDKIGEENQIIGHFGLGFYSAFMVAEKVEIDTLSYQEGADAVKWICSGGTEYELAESDMNERGTVVTLHIDQDNREFVDQYKLREIISKHCAFLPVEIFLEEDGTDKKKEETEEKPINNTHPLWLKNPKECTDEEYREFYRNVFHDYNEPLFWIHMQVDYPFNLKGILYFPKLMHEFDASEGQVKLYNNQVFVADNIKEVIPEFLVLLKGVIDCADLPLNVSRSFLQKDANVIKLSKHISKKVADKLLELYTNEKERYVKLWSDINPFVKYGCIRDAKFFERVKECLIFKTINDAHVTLQEYLDRNKDQNEKKVFYVTDEKQQAQYIRLFKEHGLDAIVLSSTIDHHFIQFLEMNEKDVKFNRIDSDLSETMKDEESSKDKTEEETAEKSKNLELLFKDALEDNTLAIKSEYLKNTEIPAIVLLSEQSRRMQEMSALFGGKDMSHLFPNERTLVLNLNSSLIKTLIELSGDTDKKEDFVEICRHIHDLAMMSHKPLDGEAMSKFIERSNRILHRFAAVK